MTPTIDRAAALGLLKSDDPHNRLAGARFFSRFARVDDAEMLKAALQDETVYWIKGALRQALERSTGKIRQDNLTEFDDGTESREGVDDDRTKGVLSEARHTTTQQLLHEIEPLVGVIKLAASREIDEYESSKLKTHLDRLDALLTVIDRLSHAAGPPQVKEFSLPEVIDEVIGAELAGNGVRVDKSGPRPLQAYGDPDFIAVALRNGLRNAIEAVGALPEEDDNRRVTVSWDEDDRGYWVAVLDWGPGPPLGFQRAFEIGTSTKGAGHFGMGLAVAEQAIISLGGDISLEPLSDERGARFHFRWEKPSDFRE